MTVIYIVPAWSDQAGQCRLVRRTELVERDARTDYERHPGQWTEVGLMNSRGELLCFDGAPSHWATLVDSQPLAAGTEFHFPERRGADV